MLIRRPHDLSGLFRDGRKRAGWSQEALADRIGASRQWVSLVENGKTSVEFDLVLAALQALGYGLFIEASDPDSDRPEPPPAPPDPSSRTPLTRNGEPLRPSATSRATRGDRGSGS